MTVGRGYDDSGRLGAVLARIAGWVDAGEIEGGALAVAVDGTQVAEWYAGMARPDLPAGPDVLWPLASISKLYTAATVMALVERGELTLGLPLGSLLHGFDGERGDGREEITLRHLLTHTSGLIYESPSMEELLLDQTPLDDMLDEGLGYPLRFTPATSSAYSDFAYLVAGKVASLATGRPFPELLRELVLDPAGLEDTFMPPVPADMSRCAQVTGALAAGTDGAMYNSPYALGLAHPAFGVVAGVRDVLRFGLLFASGEGGGVLSPATVRSMTAERMPADPLGGNPARGIGFMLNGTTGYLADLASARAWGHGGASGCVLVHDPETRVTVAWVSNRHANPDPIAFRRRLSTVVSQVLSAEC